jgi:protein-disulfide isomerase
MSCFRTLLLGAAGVALAACSGVPAGPPGSAAPSPAAAAPVTGAGVVAEVEGTPILAAELDQAAASRLARLRQEEYDIRREALDELIWERLVRAEAAKQGVSPEELVRREVEDKAKGPSDAEVDVVYRDNRARFGGASREDAVARIRQVLGQRAQQERRAEWEKQLRAKARVAVRLEPPRVKVDIPAGSPATGPETAPVTIVEFTDYQCPYCHRAQAVIDEVMARYRDKVRLVHLDFPLEGHPGAIPAARAARCAGEQGRFWDYHRSLMTAPGPLDDADLKRRAAGLGLRDGDFAACVSSPRHDEAIRASFDHGSSLGVSGTPAYFVNGRLISGARPVEAFAELIEAELAAR